MIKRIGVIGGSRLYDYLSKEISYGCGFQIAKRGFLLLTGGVGGAGLMASQGAYDFLKTAKKPTQEFILSVVPAGINPVHNYGAVLYRGSDWAERRVELIKMAKLFLVISGAFGTSNEVEIALAENKILIPLACTGGAAASAWRMLKEQKDTRIPAELIDSLHPGNKDKELLLNAAFGFIDDNRELI